LLFLFVAADFRQVAAKVVIAAVAMEIVLEHHGFHLNAVHQDDPAFRVRVHGVLVVRRGVQRFPVHRIILDALRFLFKRIHHSAPPLLCMNTNLPFPQQDKFLS
jgi:hypothetical protein